MTTLADSERKAERLRREKELAERDLRLARREIEMLRSALLPAPEQVNRAADREGAPRDIAKASISAIADLLGHFDGSAGDYGNWELQLKLLKKTYCLSDDYVKILIGMRLKGKASEWLRSKAKHIEMSLDELLEELRKMYDHRPSRVKLRKQFEERVWRRDETFHQYAHEKVILANRVPIPDEEVIEYSINGIPVESLRDQARIGDITTMAALLKASEKVTPKDRIPAGGGNSAERRKQGSGNRKRQSGEDQRQRPRAKDEKKTAASGDGTTAV